MFLSVSADNAPSGVFFVEVIAQTITAACFFVLTGIFRYFNDVVYCSVLATTAVVLKYIRHCNM